MTEGQKKILEALAAALDSDQCEAITIKFKPRPQKPKE